MRSFISRYGPWAVVTGASDGIGRAIAFELARRGLNLVIAARGEVRLEQAAREIRAASSVEVRPVPVDLGLGARRLFDETRTLDVGLLAAAAGFGTSGSFLDAELDAELQMIDVNCRAVAEQCHHYGNRFRRAGRGGIILFSSLFAFQGVPRAANYAATKAWVQSFGEALHAELAGSGVDVLVSAPGPVLSGFGARAGMQMRFGARPDQVAAGTVAALGRTTTVRPGALSKLLEWSLASTLSRRARTRILAGIARSMTRHQALPALRENP